MQALEQQLAAGWQSALSPVFSALQYQDICTKLALECQQQQIFPPLEDIYRAFSLTDFADVKVVILGQDPYHGEGQAHGLCFSVQDGTKIPPSLRNIYKELQTDLGIAPPTTGCLEGWAKQGVLLLNTTLTVRAHQAASHKKLGWQWFTDAVLAQLDAQNTPIVFLLWGGHARSKAKLLQNPNHLVLECAHPSPLSAYQGFFGCRHFSQCNDFLAQHGVAEIDWGRV